MSNINNRITGTFNQVAVFDSATGQVTGLDLAGLGNVDLGNVANVHINGGNAGSLLYTNGNANLAWSANMTYDDATGLELTGELTAGSANIVVDLLVGGDANIVGSLDVLGDAQVTGNLTVDGNIVYVNTQSLDIVDPVIQQGGGANGTPLTSDDGKDRGALYHTYNVGANVVTPLGIVLEGDIVSGTGLGSVNGDVTSILTTGLQVVFGSDTANVYTIGLVNFASSTTDFDITPVATQTYTNGSNISSWVAGTGAVVDKFIGWQNSTGNFVIGSNVTNTNNVITINSLGTLELDTVVAENIEIANVTFTGNVNLGNVSNVHINGGANGQFLQTDGNGTLMFESVRAGGTDNQVQFNENTVLGGSANLTFTPETNTFEVTGQYLQTAYNSVANGITLAGYQSRGTAQFPLELEVADQVFKINSGGFTGNGAVTIDGQPGWTDHTLMSADVVAQPAASGYRLPIDFTVQTVDTSNVTQPFTFTSNGVFETDGLAVGNVANVTISGAGTTGQFLQKNGTNVQWANVSASAAGANTEVQFNDGTNQLTATPNFTFNTATNILKIGSNTATVPLVDINSAANTYAGLRFLTTGTESWFVGHDSSSSNGSFTINSSGTSVIRATPISGGNTTMSVTGKVLANNIGATATWNPNAQTFSTGAGNIVFNTTPISSLSYRENDTELTCSGANITYNGTGTGVFAVKFSLISDDGFVSSVLRDGVSFVYSTGSPNPNDTLYYNTASTTVPMTNGSSITIQIGDGVGTPVEIFSISTITITRIA